jgi:predicted DNA-binding transcriptional regulator AlpA
MGRQVDLDDLLDANDVAELLGLSHATSIAIYRKRYEAFPAPTWASKGGRCQLWLRADIEAWATSRSGSR